MSRINKYFLIHVEKKNWDTVARTQFPELKDWDNNTVGSGRYKDRWWGTGWLTQQGWTQWHSPIQGEKKYSSVKEKVIQVTLQTGLLLKYIFHSLFLFLFFFSTLDKKRRWPLSLCSFRPVLLPLFYLIPREGHHRFLTKAIDSQVFR